MVWLSEQVYKHEIMFINVKLCMNIQDTINEKRRRKYIFASRLRGDPF